MAANAAASVVWLTGAAAVATMVALASGVTALSVLPVDFASGFFVTGAFNCTGAALAATLGEDFTAAVFVIDFAVVAVDLAAVFATTLDWAGAAFVKAFAGDFTLFSDTTAMLFVVADLAGLAFLAGLTAALEATGLVLFATLLEVFADFFIEFAMESTVN